MLAERTFILNISSKGLVSRMIEVANELSEQNKEFISKSIAGDVDYSEPNIRMSWLALDGLLNKAREEGYDKGREDEKEASWDPAGIDS